MAYYNCQRCRHEAVIEESGGKFAAKCGCGHGYAKWPNREMLVDALINDWGMMLANKETVYPRYKEVKSGILEYDHDMPHMDTDRIGDGSVPWSDFD